MDFLFIVTPIVGVCTCSMFCCTLICVLSGIAIILMGKRELVALLDLSSWCLLVVGWLFLAVPWGCLQFVIVVFPDHTHLLLFFSRGGDLLNDTPSSSSSPLAEMTMSWACHFQFCGTKRQYIQVFFHAIPLSYHTGCKLSQL